MPQPGRIIAVHLVGGLGNQMFQYAAGAALAARIGARLLLDTSDLTEGQSHYGFELPNAFVGEFPTATAADVRSLLKWQYPVRRFLSRRAFGRVPFLRLLIEPQFAYWPEIEHVEDSKYLVGYWQSEQYFADFERSVRAAFRFRPPDTANREVAGRIAATESVSLHVRRGDYVSNSKINSFHGLCSPEYYRKAVAYIKERVLEPMFFVFSDDLRWCRDTLGLPSDTTFVGINQGKQSFNDMRLMSLCKHNIIANSTFSWWGAWLNESAEKIVVAPERWFVAPGENADTLYPSTWVRL